MGYPDSVRFLYSLGNEIKTAKLGLERITSVLQALGDPQRACRFVHVAGTNGKGSTCAMIESGLRAAGVRTGLYTSPHLIEPTERIRIAGSSVSAPQFSDAFDQVHAVAEKLLAEGTIDLHPTYFETVTAMAFLLFRDQQVETAVLEVGMGGRLDATNVVTPEIAVVTRVDFDHEAFLGKSIEEIAGEKAGILKPGVPAVFAEQRPEAGAVLEERAAALGLNSVTWTRTIPIADLAVTRDGHSFRMDGLRVECPLAGVHQVENSRTATVVLRKLGTPDEAIEAGIRHAVWRGRLQRVSTEPEIIVDGAHNPSGARALASHIVEFYPKEQVTLIYGTMRDKAVEEMAGILFPVAGCVIATAPRQPRAARPETILELTDHPNLLTARNLEEALRFASERDRRGRLSHTTFISGSLFLVAEALELLVK